MHVGRRYKKSGLRNTCRGNIAAVLTKNSKIPRTSGEGVTAAVRMAVLGLCCEPEGECRFWNQMLTAAEWVVFGEGLGASVHEGGALSLVSAVWSSRMLSWGFCGRQGGGYGGGWGFQAKWYRTPLPPYVGHLSVCRTPNSYFQQGQRTNSEQQTPTQQSLSS